MTSCLRRSLLNEVVDQDNKRGGRDEAGAWEVEGVAEVLRGVHQPSWQKDTQNENKPKISGA